MALRLPRGRPFMTGVYRRGPQAASGLDPARNPCYPGLGDGQDVTGLCDDQEHRTSCTCPGTRAGSCRARLPSPRCPPWRGRRTRAAAGRALPPRHRRRHPLPGQRGICWRAMSANFPAGQGRRDRPHRQPRVRRGQEDQRPQTAHRRRRDPALSSVQTGSQRLFGRAWMPTTSTKPSVPLKSSGLAV
jgi:hypothetical protein